MLFLARLRLFASIFIALTPLGIYARDDSLFTSSVTYCAPPETLLIRQFDIAFVPKNSSIFFNVSASSVEANVSVAATLFLNVYGLTPVNVTLDLCNVLSGALCPLPVYNFTGSQWLQLPDSIDVNKIPSIALAYVVPDLEAYAQLTLTDLKTGKIKACVQATLSNGWSTHQRAVEFSTGGLAIMTLMSAVWQSLSPDALAPYRLFDLMFLYQSIVTTSFLSLNYPSLYRGFALNFAWAMGLFSTDSTSSLQNSINRMRHLTGGASADASTSDAVGLVNRKLSPYNDAIHTNLQTSVQSLFAVSSAKVAPAFKNLFAPVSNTSAFSDIKQLSVVEEVATVTAASANTLQAGLPIYVSYIHIATANAFMTVFISFLMYAALALAIFLTGYGVLFALKRFQWGNQEKVIALRSNYRSFVEAWTLRLSLIALAPVIIFVFYQWTIKDSWLSTFISVLVLLAIGVYVIFRVFQTMRLAIGSSPEELYNNHDHLVTHGPLYGQYRIPRYFFFLVALSAIFVKALLVAFAKGHGEVQIIMTLIIDFLVFLSHVVFKPHKTRGGDVLSTYLSIVRLVTTGLMIAFIQSLHVTPIIRTVIGGVIAVIFSVAVVVMFFNMLINCGWQHVLRKGRQPSSHSGSSTLAGSNPSSLLEKGQGDDLSSIENEKRLSGRPGNPTPDHGGQHSAATPSHLYPMVTPTPSSAGFPSVGSGSTTLGSLVSRHWSFSPEGSPPNPSPLHNSSPLEQSSTTPPHTHTLHS